MNLSKNLSTLAMATFALVASTAPVNTTPAHLQQADALVNALRTQGENGVFTDAQGNALNQYGASYANVVMVWGPTAKVNAVCANFITVLLENSYAGWTAKNAGFNSNSPNPAMYHDAIEANACGFEKVDEFEDIEAGDFLVSKYLDGSSIGHAMIVRNAAMVTEDEETGEKTWAVEIIDCSKDTHTNDSRVFLGKKTQGAGRGVMRVFTLDGEITGYSWSFSSGSIIYGPNTRHLTLGRLSS
jgi:hypothetical protein